MPLIEIGKGAFHTDGGLREVAPLRAAIELLADDITCIVCQAEELDARTFKQGNLLELIERLMDIITNETVANDLRLLGNESKLRKDLLQAKGQEAKREATVRTIRPIHSINADLKEFTAIDIKNMIRTGHSAALAPTVAAPVTLTIE
jgi:hypothetical protein